MPNASDIIKLAKSYVGTKESPAYSNNVIFNTHYYGHPVSDGNGASYPWCVTFVWDIFRMAGASNLFYDGKKTAWCDAVRDWAKSRGLVVNKAEGKHGDLVLFDWNNNYSADHIGFIDCKNPNGTYQTVEGNTSAGNNSNGGEVQIRTRYLSEIMMVIRPKYEIGSNADASQTPSVGSAKIDLPNLRKGSSNNSVRAAMILLKDKGYYADSIPSWDTTFGPKMDAAVRQFQRDNSLSVDGIIGEKTWAALLNNDAKKIQETTNGGTVNMELRILSKGMAGNDVHAAMVLLKDKGYYPYTIPASDKTFGAKMDAGVRKMQTEHGLGTDGIIGQKSWTFLLK